MGKKTKVPKENRVEAQIDYSAFTKRMSEAGVSPELRRYIEDFVRCEQARATDAAAKLYVAQVEGYPISPDEFPVGDMLELLARRSNGVYAAILSLGEEFGRDNFIYEGVSQMAFDVSRFARKVSTAYSASATIKWHRDKPC